MVRFVFTNFVAIFQLLSLLRFSFGGATTASSDVSSSNTKEAEDEEEDEPPKVEVKTVVEEDSIHSVR